MPYVVAPNGVYSYTVTHSRDITWDATHRCPAYKLTPDEATLFGVSLLMPSDPPAFDPATQAVDEINPAPVNGVWTQQWLVRAATQAEMDAYAATLAAQAQAAADAAAKAEAKADAVITYLVSHTPAQIAAKVAADVTNLATAKTYIAKLAIAVGVLARRELR